MLIQRLRNSRFVKLLSVFLILNILAEIAAPSQALALTGGPSQPEFSSFTPVGVSDMVDLSSGDLNYNLPLLDVGGYPINMSYSSSVGMDDEASWVGLGWNLSIGQISRNVRGLPDDFAGDEMTYEDHMKDNVTVGATLKFTPALFGIEEGDDDIFDGNGDTTYQVGNVTYGISATYNNYNGFSIRPSVGIQMDLGKAASVGFNAESGPDGLTLSPSLSIHEKGKENKERDNMLGLNFGVSMNSRQGLVSTTLSPSRKSKKDVFANRLANSALGLISSTISFTDQLYTPSKRIPMETGSFTVNAALGAELFGGEGQGQVTAYGTVQRVAQEERKAKAYGYERTELANADGVLDFNREKDGSFSVNSTNLPLTNYTYDIYSVQGQGVGGMYRPFRNQVGFVFDSYVQDGSFSGSFGAEFGTGNAVHAGVDIEETAIESHSGAWTRDNMMTQFLVRDDSYNADFEPVHFRNVGDLGMDRDYNIFTDLGSYQAIRIPYAGSKFHRYAKSEYRIKYNGEGNEIVHGINSRVKRTQRQLRNQAIHNVTVGSFGNGIGYGPCVNRNGSVGYALPAEAKPHHTGEVQILRNDGARYIYGIPVYNKTKREVTFAIENTGNNVNCATGLVSYSNGDNSVNNSHNDEYFSRVTTPGYAHTYLLTSVLSADYQDRTGNGPTADDFGSYTKFTYTRKNENYNWRIPFMDANYNEGLKTDPKDDQGNYVFGTKEMTYISKIETKTHVAIFHISPRNDARGVKDEDGGHQESTTQSAAQNQYSYKLDRIDLYSIEEYNAYGNAAKPIKSVHFEYDYYLCQGVPNNVKTSGILDDALDDNERENQGGKLTLRKVYFTYRNSYLGKYTSYDFHYDNINPNYNIKGYDYWGQYKATGMACSNSSPATAAEFSFTDQDRATQDQNSSAWTLSSIDLPSGGKIEIEYESDSYSHVQDKEALQMFKISGTGDSESPSGFAPTTAAFLYRSTIPNKPYKYLYARIPDALATGQSTASLQQKFLSNVGEHIYFRFLANMTQQGGSATSGSILNSSKFDYVTGYFKVDMGANMQVFTGTDNHKYLSVPIETVDREGGVNPWKQVHPVSKATWQFGRRYLSQHVYSTQPNGDTEDIEAIVSDLFTPQILNNILEVFRGPNTTLENKLIGRNFLTDKSWIRMRVPGGEKLGGGSRVKQVRISDMWEDMQPGTGTYQTMRYGQSYNYVQENGKTSGVATYEPVGNKENPFVQPVFATEKHLLAPDDQNFVEKPFGESFFPSPQVTYARVEVKSLVAGDAPEPTVQNEEYSVKKLHRTGKVVTEFYTSRDYPTIVDQTILEAKEDKQQVLDNILKLNSRKHFTASQGYVVHLNDMNGKQKSQRVYAEGQETFISGVDYLYDNYESPTAYNASNDPQRNRGRLNNNVVVIQPDGSVSEQVIGVEYDIINDLRENSSKTQTFGVNTNLATFIAGFIVGMVPVPLPDYSQSTDQFRSVSTTKVVNTFGILKETIAYDAGARVSTRNLAWDAYTGEVLLTETVDEYNDLYYTMNYPAHWYYGGMAQASYNLDFKGTMAYSGGTFSLQDLPSGKVSEDYLIDGDEIYLYGNADHFGWVYEVNGNTFKVMDDSGNDITSYNGVFRVIRSGHRNLQSAGIMNVTLMRNPLLDGNGQLISQIGSQFLNAANYGDWRIINAGAVDYSDYWPASCECGITGTDGTYNPYRQNELGVWRTRSSRTYLTGRNFQALTTPRQEGFFNTFDPMYKCVNNVWTKDMTDWTFVALVSKFSPYGFELENVDALMRFSAAQYGYNNTFPMAVGANTRYRELGFDGFEDYGFEGCPISPHFKFDAPLDPNDEDGTSASGTVSNRHSHTGRYSIKVGGNQRVTMRKSIDCAPDDPVIDGSGTLDPGEENQ